MIQKKTFQVNKRLLPMKITFFLLDFGTAPINPMLTTIAKQRGIPVFIIGIIFTFLPILNVLVRPLAGYVTDRWRCRKAFCMGASFINAFLTPALHFIPSLTDQQKSDGVDILTTWSFWLFLSIMMLRSILWMVGDVLQDAICIEILGEDKEKYSLQRIYGAFGCGLSTVFTGWCVDLYSQGQIEKNYLPAYLISMVSLIVHVFAVYGLDSRQISSSKNMSKEIGKVLSDVKVLFYLLWSVIGGAFTAFIWFYLYIYIDDLAKFYHPERKPWIKTIQGLTFTIQCCVGELPIYLWSKYILRKIGHMTAFSIGFLCFGIRFYLYSVIIDPVWVLPVELLNGVSFAILFLSGISYAAKVAPPGSEGTLQGLFGMAFQGLGISIGCFVAGFTFDKIGSLNSFRLMSYVAFASFLVQVIINQLVQRRRTKKHKSNSNQINT
ncbi:major facilitator superfamily domain-containing protein 6-B-like [Daktulosphaira vitifoliae]|uniref:major facilitator superfamily domain-containing protein 6-B-like n=1 Tax=Daktulosphaira vitifoliae TaxID=58002 RepID=UPI0021AA67ED|nr:major facilitator superfamily domain-containing protein 6-B-like [Daktulosphaira vitifoliae]XP_050548935.1 major facilitator superfamily domain-containing protein 6-B-like [Daktulosphaira vitifoliae]XP_050548936.1 major facilitator superfamily domain-containing protein 6-B-like [Daktulosphaira vitifoliae]XP_050548937.1 major facilitator superfamily domain-containing protein 6-B-like [Daktulosphaira vitifoliae]XP_050548938.1 major facilitator superfamily domain-containing protein 6-B-like [Da